MKTNASIYDLDVRLHGDQMFASLRYVDMLETMELAGHLDRVSPSGCGYESSYADYIYEVTDGGLAEYLLTYPEEVDSVGLIVYIYNSKTYVGFNFRAGIDNGYNIKQNYFYPLYALYQKSIGGARKVA